MSQFSIANIYKSLGQFSLFKKKKSVDYHERKYLLFCEYKFKKKLSSKTLCECYDAKKTHFFDLFRVCKPKKEQKIRFILRQYDRKKNQQIT